MFGTLYGLILILPWVNQFYPAEVITRLLLYRGAFFVIYRLTFAVAWNVRARALRKTSPEGHAPD